MEIESYSLLYSLYSYEPLKWHVALGLLPSSLSCTGFMTLSKRFGFRVSYEIRNYCIVLYYAILHSIMLLLYYIIFCFVWYCIVLYCIVLYCIVLLYYCFVLCCVMLYMP